MIPSSQLGEGVGVGVGHGAPKPKRATASTKCPAAQKADTVKSWEGDVSLQCD